MFLFHYQSFLSVLLQVVKCRSKTVDLINLIIWGMGVVNLKLRLKCYQIVEFFHVVY